MRKQEAINKAAQLCSKQEKCKSEIIQKLRDWQIEEDEIEEIIEKLVTNKFIDEQRFAEAFVRTKFKINKWGKVKISYALSEKKIASQTIELAIEEINDTLYRETLTALINTKAKSTKAKNNLDKKNKLFRFAASRGFESELIHSILNELIEH